MEYLRQKKMDSGEKENECERERKMSGNDGAVLKCVTYPPSPRNTKKTVRVVLSLALTPLPRV